MVYSARVLSLLLAFCIALITVLFLSLVEGVSQNALLVGFAISFSVSYLLIFVILEFLIFKEIDKIYKLLNKLKKQELKGINKQHPGALNPLKNINDEIFTLAEIKQQEIDELKKLEAFRREFIANVSHELKTPIFAAQGFVHTLIDGAVNDKTVRTKFLKKAAKSLDGLDALVQDLLTLSHIETGQIKMNFEKIDLTKITEEVIEQLEDKAARRDVRMIIEKSDKETTAYADWLRINQVLTNLISNGVKYSREGGEVRIRFHVSKKSIITYVQDSGEGIPIEFQSRIFERFFRVDKSRSREKGGTGLGLAIVKHILEGHGTKAEVESKPGEGSTFSFKLPRNSK